MDRPEPSCDIVSVLLLHIDTYDSILKFFFSQVDFGPCKLFLITPLKRKKNQKDMMCKIVHILGTYCMF